jgi:6,7-dimethyl-8-ribityllumazine synthase
VKAKFMTHILLVEANFYTHISAALADGAIAACQQANATYDRLVVPGALEIPGAIALAATSAKYDAYVALGCVIRGETSHYETVCNESARGIMDLTVRAHLPIGNGILTVENEAQALRRADKSQLDKGGGAVKAALALLAAKQHFAAA